MTDSRAAAPLLDRLAELAAAATPGPWHSEAEFGGWWVVTGGPNDYAVHPATEPMPGVVLGGAYSGGHDAAYIAAASPDVVAALVAVARAARETLDRLEVRVDRQTLTGANTSATALRQALTDLEAAGGTR